MRRFLRRLLRRPHVVSFHSWPTDGGGAVSVYWLSDGTTRRVVTPPDPDYVPPDPDNPVVLGEGWVDVGYIVED